LFEQLVPEYRIKLSYIQECRVGEEEKIQRKPGGLHKLHYSKNRKPNRRQLYSVQAGAFFVVFVTVAKTVDVLFTTVVLVDGAGVIETLIVPPLILLVLYTVTVVTGRVV
jgi:hypothetical protein